ncbi:MAG: hypothetical protein Q9M29_10445, partial [Mariprofundaceae bacterium]|nr:hypothetical protein [Mariprofundaceae bacterium]
MRQTTISLLLFLTLLLSACGRDMPQLFWDTGAGKDEPAYARGAPGAAGATSRPPLDVPPDLRGTVEVPMPEKIAGRPQAGDAVIRNKPVAGKAVSLDARVYDQPVDVVFSAAVDAMTALNLPVASVDSPSGTVTTDWVRHDANTKNTSALDLGGLFGQETVRAIRHRFIVRVLRLKTEAGEKTQLQIRTLGQIFVNRHWVN